MPYSLWTASYGLSEKKRRLRRVQKEAELLKGGDPRFEELRAEDQRFRTRIEELRGQAVPRGGRVLIDSMGSRFHHFEGVMKERHDDGASVSVERDGKRRTVRLPWTAIVPHSEKTERAWRLVDSAFDVMREVLGG